MLTDEDGAEMAVPLDEVKAYLRIARDEEDDVLAGLLRSAAGLCERFIGQWLVAREARETVAGDGRWQRLSARPVLSIESVTAADGAALAVGAYAIDVDAAGDGWVRSMQADGPGVLAVRYRAGLAGEMSGLPDALRQGIVRLAADHYLARGNESAAPPAVVSALWRPFRRMRLA